MPSALQRIADCFDETSTAAERTKETDSRLRGAPCKPAPCAKDVYATCVEALSPAPLSRRKEDDSRVGSGAQNQAIAAAEVPKINHTDRKRRRREEQNTLVARLDRLLPDESRRGGFKGTGSRSAGVWGRSFFNVLSDSIEYLKNLGPHSGSIAPMALPTMGLTYKDSEQIPPIHPPLYLVSDVQCLCFCSESALRHSVYGLDPAHWLSEGAYRPGDSLYT